MPPEIYSLGTFATVYVSGECVGSIQGLSTADYTSLNPLVDVYATRIPPRHGRYRTKRLRKKWAKLYSKTTVYRGCYLAHEE